ncbi:SLC13 family permease [Paenibacillus sp. J5C_2022]|uniref:SLC13 family permease n=1 Tax=Paenibacillus sp. J5C2022 TaxID=2977129 RepID=UPI0021CE8ECC|nr:SLC13 family permease [Paenibacillus sp. J5C2022]MCU6709845.1 SLC13 family permease [Paenibacillus sp. J5C2022]
MNTEMIITLSILAGAAALFASGKIRSDMVAIMALILLVVLDILNPAEALSGFANSVVIMMIGLFIVGGGIFHTGLARQVSGRLLKLAGQNETKLLVTVMLASSFIGAFVSNTGTVAVMLPIVVSLAMSAGVSPGRLLMPLAFASSLGGTLTLIGTPPNMVIRETLMKAGVTELTFFSFTPVGAVALAIGTVLIIVLSKFLLPKSSGDKEGGKKRRSLQELAQQYSLSDNLYRVQAKRGSLIIGKPLKELSLTGQYGIHISEVRRKSSHKNPFFKTLNGEVAGPDTIVEENDILYVKGFFPQVEAFARECELELLAQHAAEREQASTDGYASTEVGIAEVLIPPNSKHINQLVKHSGFREQYNLNILGIQRRGGYLLHQLKEERMRSGDALLVQGAWKSIAKLSQEHADVVVVGQPEEAEASVPLSHKAPIAAAVMIAMVVLMIADIFPAVVSVMIAAVLMVATGCLRNMEEAYKTVNWESIVLIGGMIPMSIAVEKTGAAALISEKLVLSLGSFGPLALLAGVYFATSFVTLFISNTASAVLFAPIALGAALQLGVNPVPYLFAVTLAASICFAVPFSTPPNALVMSAGRYTFMDYVRIGLPAQVLLGVVMVLVLPLFFPF